MTEDELVEWFLTVRVAQQTHWAGSLTQPLSHRATLSGPDSLTGSGDAARLRADHGAVGSLALLNTVLQDVLRYLSGVVDIFGWHVDNTNVLVM
jgi:hypothetical protein